eukprot:1158032-Pelagomonas_calceolata.AAC.4
MQHDGLGACHWILYGVPGALPGAHHWMSLSSKASKLPLYCERIAYAQRQHVGNIMLCRPRTS